MREAGNVWQMLGNPAWLNNHVGISDTSELHEDF